MGLFKCTLVIGLVAATFTASTQIATAGGCGHPVYIPPSYSYNNVIVEKETTIIAPVAVPVVIPATVFQYQPAILPTAPVQTAPMPVATQPQMPAQAALPSNEELDRLIRARIEAILKEYTAGTGPPPMTFEPVSYNSVPASPGPQVSDQVYVATLSENCARCHGGGRRSGGVQLFDTQNRYAPTVSEKQIADAISSGAMPKNSRLTPQAMLILLKHNVRL